MGLNDPASNGEAQPGATGIGAAATVSARERVENGGQQVPFDTGAVIRHRDQDAPADHFAVCVVFQTAQRDMPWACLGCAIAYGGVLLGSAINGADLGCLFGTIVAVVFANQWAGWTGRPTTIVLLPAIITLVGGSVGFRGLVAMTEGDVARGEQQFLQMFIVGLAIAAGLLVGHTIARPRMTL